jgi:hypothetical protein
MSDAKLNNLCTRFRLRLQSTLLTYGAFRAAFFLLLPVALFMLCDWYFRFSTQGRFFGLVGVIIIGGLCLWFDFIRPLRRNWSNDEVLSYLDRTLPNQHDALVCLRDLTNPDAMREADTEQGRKIIAEVVAELEQKVDAVELSAVVNRRPISRWMTMVFFLLGAYVFGCIIIPSFVFTGLLRLANPWGDYLWPQETYLIVEEPEAGWMVPKGEPFLVRTHIKGKVPSKVFISYRNESSKLQIEEAMAVANIDPEEKKSNEVKFKDVDGIATFRFSDMVEPLEFFCTGGDHKEKNLKYIKVAERPIITKVEALLTPPSYARLPKKKITSGQLAGLEATVVDAEFTASAGLSKATIAFQWEGEDKESEQLDLPVKGDTFKHQFTLTRNGVYTLTLTDKNGLKNGKPERFEIRVTPDDMPAITLNRPRGNLILTSRGKVDVEFKATDDFNLSKVEVRLGPRGADGKSLSDRITGPLLKGELNPVSEGRFEIDFFKEKSKGTFKDFSIDKGVELELYVWAKDCNPNDKGVAESTRIQLSFMDPTNFMDEVVLKAKELMTDARTGWFNAAGAMYDGDKWTKSPTSDEELEKILAQQETAERSAIALDTRFPDLIEHMVCNRMQAEFMSRRLERIGVKIQRLKNYMPEVAQKIAEGRPKSAEESKPDRRRAKMAGALKAARSMQNTAAWEYKFLYDHLADWVALQSVLIKTKRIEETQREVNELTEKLVKKTLGMEREEYDETTVREMQEISHKQQTAHDIEEAVEEALQKLIFVAEREKRRKVWQILLTTFNRLREDRTKDKLKRAAMAIAEGRGSTVKNQQNEILTTIAEVNAGLVKAGDEVTEDSPIPGDIVDPRDMATDADGNPVAKGEDIKQQDFEELIRNGMDGTKTVLEAKKGTLDEALQEIFGEQETVFNHTIYVGERLGNKKMPGRYMRLRKQMFSYREDEVIDLLRTALGRAEKFAADKAAEKIELEGGVAVPPDPTNGKAQELLVKSVKGWLASAEDVKNMLSTGDFADFCSGLQKNIQRGAGELRSYLQARDEAHKLHEERKAKKHVDEFLRKYLLNEGNLDVAIEIRKDLEWALVEQYAAQRETQLLDKIALERAASAAAQKSAERLSSAATERQQTATGIVENVYNAVKEKIQDPTEKEKDNEVVRPLLTSKVTTPLLLKDFREAAAFMKDKKYSGLAMKQEMLRDALSASLISLKDLFEERVREKPDEPPPPPGKGEEDDIEDLSSEKPEALAEFIEKEGEWLDVYFNSPEPRKKLIDDLRKRADFDPRYRRLIIRYFQAVAKNFQTRSKAALELEKKKKEKELEEQKKKDAEKK